VVSREVNGQVCLSLQEGGAPAWAYLAFSTDTQARWGFLFKHAPNKQNFAFSLNGNNFICETDGMAFYLAVTEGQVADRSHVNHSLAGWRQNINLPDCPGLRNPHYAVSAYLHHVYKLPIKTAEPTSAPQVELMGKYHQLDKGSKDEAEFLNRLMTLPNGTKFYGKLSGIWLVADRGGKLEVLGALVAKNFELYSNFKATRFLPLLQEQADLLKGSGGVLEILIQLGETK
jgi:hypothetical protein